MDDQKTINLINIIEEQLKNLNDITNKSLQNFVNLKIVDLYDKNNQTEFIPIIKLEETKIENPKPKNNEIFKSRRRRRGEVDKEYKIIVPDEFINKNTSKYNSPIDMINPRYILKINTSEDTINYQVINFILDQKSYFNELSVGDVNSPIRI